MKTTLAKAISRIFKTEINENISKNNFIGIIANNEFLYSYEKEGCVSAEKAADLIYPILFNEIDFSVNSLPHVYEYVFELNGIKYSFDYTNDLFNVFSYGENEMNNGFGFIDNDEFPF